jgi:hypothetical protein
LLYPHDEDFFSGHVRRPCDKIHLYWFSGWAELALLGEPPAKRIIDDSSKLEAGFPATTRSSWQCDANSRCDRWGAASVVALPGEQLYPRNLVWAWLHGDEFAAAGTLTGRHAQGEADALLTIPSGTKQAQHEAQSDVTVLGGVELGGIYRVEKWARDPDKKAYVPLWVWEEVDGAVDDCVAGGAGAWAESDMREANRNDLIRGQFAGPVEFDPRIDYWAAPEVPDMRVYGVWHIWR